MAVAAAAADARSADGDRVSKLRESREETCSSCCRSSCPLVSLSPSPCHMDSVNERRLRPVYGREPLY